MAESGEPGPVVIEIAHSVLKERMDKPQLLAPAPEKPLCADTGQRIREIVKIITDARQCGLYVGKGAQSSSDQVRQLAELLCAPVATTISGKGVIPENHELSAGFGFGPSGSKSAEALFKKCDVVLAMGVKFSEMSAGKWLRFAGALIHIDRCGETLNRNYKAKVALCLDVETALEEILSHLKGSSPKEETVVAEAIRRHRQAHLKKVRKTSFERGIHPSCFFYRLGEAIGPQAIIVTDCGAHQLWAITDYCALTPNSFLSPSDFQAMGFGIPAAVGASLGRPEKCTVCVCGDGGFLMTGFELLTAVRRGLNLAVVVFNDGALGLIENSQRILYGRTAEVRLANPDFKGLAAAFHVDYLAVADEQQLDAALERIKENRGVVLVDVTVDYQEWPSYMRGIARAAWRRLPVLKKLDLIAYRAVRLMTHGK
jgi:acetolactate synthase-1/2/3 large subunit